MPEFALSDLAAELEARLRARRLMALPGAWTDDLVFPAYDGLSLYNVPRTVARLLGVAAFKDRLLDETVWAGQPPYGQVERVVLFLSDGLGYLWLRQVLAEDAEVAASVAALSDGRGPLPLTSITPSTTVAALNTLWSGLSPAGHGVVGLTMFLREFSMIGSMLDYAPATGDHRGGDFERWGLDPQTFVPAPSLPELLAQVGVPTHLLLHRSLMGSGLSKMLHRGIPRETRHTHAGYGDFWLRLGEVLRATAGQRCYVNVYWPAVDTLAHAYGAQTAYVRQEVREQLARLRAVLDDESVQDGRTLVLFLADHGHYDATQTVDISGAEYAPIAAESRGHFSGEPRLAYLHLRHGRLHPTVAALEGRFADRLSWFTPGEGLSAGLFGPDALYEETLYRLGDLIVTPRLGWRLESPLVRPWQLISWHGGLADWEMFIPLLWRRL